MRGSALVGIVCALTLTSPCPAETPWAPPDDSGYFQEIVPVTQHVWVLAEPKFQVQPIGNVTVIEQADGLVLVDAGGSAGSGRRIVEMVRSLSPKPVTAVIISEWHGDKPQGLSEILKAWPNARTIATAATAAHLADPRTMNTPAAPDAARNAAFVKEQQDTAAYMADLASKAKTLQDRAGFARAATAFGDYAADADGTLTIAPKESFQRRLVLADTQAPVQALFLGRANTDGDAVVWLPKQRIMIAGETVIAPFPYGYESYPGEWLGVLAKLRAYPFRTLIPGHGAPQHDRAQIDRIAAALRHVRDQVRRLAAAGLTQEQTQAKVDLAADRRAFVGDDPWLGRWFSAFFVKPIVASAYKEAKGQPITQGLGG